MNVKVIVVYGTVKPGDTIIIDDVYTENCYDIRQQGQLVKAASGRTQPIENIQVTKQND